MRITIIFSLTLFNITCSCGNKNKETQHLSEPDTLQIISKLKKGEKAYLYYYDHFQDLNMPIEFKDSMNVKIPFKNFLLLKDTEKQIAFPIFTSERVYVFKTENQITLLKSDNENRTKELSFLATTIQKNQLFFSDGKNLQYQQILMQIKDDSIKNLVSKEYISKVKEMISSTYLLNLVAPIFISSKVKGNHPLLPTETITKSAQSFQDESLLKNADFRRALIGYTKILAGKSINNTSEFQNTSNIINSNFKGKIKDFLLFYHLKNVRNQDEIFKEYLQTYLKTSPSEDYKTYLSEKYLNNSKITKGELLSEKNESEDYSTLISNSKGRVIYIDFWASWCMPCRAEIPATKKLIENYKDMPVRFITISMDENKVAWRKAIEFEKLNETLNYQLVTNFESSLAKEFKIQSIPRYVIIGKNGKIINSNAPRPSDPKISKVFDELLKSK